MEAILSASARILVEGGIEALNTNRVAERAGVSIGSLYQYFPGKAALIAALGARHRRDVSGLLMDAFDEAMSEPLEAGLRRIIRANIAIHALDPDFHRMLKEVEASFADPENEEWRRDLAAAAERFLALHRQGLGQAERRIAVFVIGALIEGAVHGAVVDRAIQISTAALEKALLEAVMGYLDRIRVAE